MNALTPEQREIVARLQSRRLMICDGQGDPNSDGCGGQGYTGAAGQEPCPHCYGAGVMTPELRVALASAPSPEAGAGGGLGEQKGDPASPSGSQASPEAPTDPRPVGFDPSRAWQDIRTAPTDDRLILAGCPACEQFPEGRVMIWRASMLNRNQKGPTPQHLSFPATHWAPLLPAPAAGGRPESYRAEYRLAAWLVSFAQKQLDENRDWHSRNRLRWAAEALIGEDAVLALAGEAAQAAETHSGSVHEHAAPHGATPEATPQSSPSQTPVAWKYEYCIPNGEGIWEQRVSLDQPRDGHWIRALEPLFGKSSMHDRAETTEAALRTLQAAGEVR